MDKAEHWEPYELRGSRTVLGARGGETPSRDSLAALPPVGDFGASRGGVGALDAGRLGGRNGAVAGAAGGSAAPLRDRGRQTARRRHTGASAGAGQRQDQDGAAVDVCSR